MDDDCSTVYWTLARTERFFQLAKPGRLAFRFRLCPTDQLEQREEWPSPFVSPRSSWNCEVPARLFGEKRLWRSPVTH